jgi:hypothetical protein
MLEVGHPVKCAGDDKDVLGFHMKFKRSEMQVKVQWPRDTANYPYTRIWTLMPPAVSL